MHEKGIQKVTMTWQEVLSQHKSLRGIAFKSLLVDGGESGYANRFLPDGSVLYPGEGLVGNQQPLRGNQILLEAHADSRAMRVFWREAPNQWQDLGLYLVAEVKYSYEEAEKRYVYWFTLIPPGPKP